jgi:hypothetical protein
MEGPAARRRLAQLESDGNLCRFPGGAAMAATGGLTMIGSIGGPGVSSFRLNRAKARKRRLCWQMGNVHRPFLSAGCSPESRCAPPRCACRLPMEVAIAARHDFAALRLLAAGVQIPVTTWNFFRWFYFRPRRYRLGASALAGSQVSHANVMESMLWNFHAPRHRRVRRKYRHKQRRRD